MESLTSKKINMSQNIRPEDKIENLDHQGKTMIFFKQTKQTNKQNMQANKIKGVCITLEDSENIIYES
jgi:RNA-binding protein YhbY